MTMPLEVLVDLDPVAVRILYVHRADPVCPHVDLSLLARRVTERDVQVPKVFNCAIEIGRRDAEVRRSCDVGRAELALDEVHRLAVAYSEPPDIGLTGAALDFRQEEHLLIELGAPIKVPHLQRHVVEADFGGHAHSLRLGREVGCDRCHVLIPPTSILSMTYRVDRHSDPKSSGAPAERHTVMA